MPLLAGPLAALAGAAWVLLVSTLTGGWVAGREGAPWAVRLALGWAVLSVAGAGLCLLGVAWPAAWILLAALFLLAAWRGRPREKWTMWRSAEAGALLLLMGYWGVRALAPEHLFDAAGYHLGLPAEWLRTGRYPDRIGFFELLPQGMETVFAYALATGAGDASARLAHLACLPAIAGLLAALARQCGVEESRGWAAGLMVASAPVALLFGSSAYTDAAWTLALLAALYLFLAAHPGRGGRAWVLAGMVAGFAYAVKMPGLAAVAAGTAVLGVQRRWRELGWFGAGAAAVMAPWILRSWTRTGNPFAPLLNGLFPNPWFGVETDQYVRAAVQPGLGAPAMLRGLLWEGGASGGFFGPALLLLILAPAAWRLPKLRPVLLAGLALTVFFASNPTARYLLPAFAALLLCAAAVLPPRLARAWAFACALATLPPLAARYAPRDARYSAEWPWRAALGVESRDAYLRRVMPVYAMAEWVNARVPAGAAIFDCAGLPQFYVRHQLIGHWTSRAAMEMHAVFLRSPDNRALAAPAARRLGIEWLVLPPGAESVAWARDLIANPDAWRMSTAGGVNGFRLYRIAPAEGLKGLKGTA